MQSHGWTLGLLLMLLASLHFDAADADYFRCFSCGSEQEACRLKGNDLRELSRTLCAGRLNACAMRLVEQDGRNLTQMLYCQAARASSCWFKPDPNRPGHQRRECELVCNQHELCNAPDLSAASVSAGAVGRPVGGGWPMALFTLLALLGRSAAPALHRLRR